ncbi:hypothetical protein SLA2020_277040 [Shorea laevis]
MEEHGCWFLDFSGHTFPTFDGTGGFIEAENRLNDMEELLEATTCALEQRSSMLPTSSQERQRDGGKLGRCYSYGVRS